MEGKGIIDMEEIVDKLDAILKGVSYLDLPHNYILLGKITHKDLALITLDLIKSNKLDVEDYYVAKHKDYYLEDDCDYVE